LSGFVVIQSELVVQLSDFLSSFIHVWKWGGEPFMNSSCNKVEVWYPGLELAQGTSHMGCPELTGTNYWVRITEHASLEWHAGCRLIHVLVEMVYVFMTRFLSPKRRSVAHRSGPNPAGPVFRTATCGGLCTGCFLETDRMRVPLNTALDVPKSRAMHLIIPCMYDIVRR
jgi:hypothetical protein